MREDLAEDRGREREVLVLLHVEVEEDAVLARGPVQRQEPLHDPRARPVEVPRDELRRDGRHLDRHVVDVGPPHEREGALEAGVRLGLAEHGLAEEVDVERVALRAGPGEVRAEAAAGVGHEVAHELAQAHARGRHDDARQHRRDARPDAQERPVDRPEERPALPASSPRRPSARAATCTSWGRATSSTNRTASSRPAGSETSAPSRSAVLRARASPALAGGEPAPGQRDGLLDEVVRGGEARVADGSGVGAAGRARRCSSSRVPRVAATRLVRSGAT